MTFFFKENLGWKEVTVKMLNPDETNGEYLNAVEKLLSEINVLSFINESGNHQNIISIFGAYTLEKEKRVVELYMELCSTSLENYLVRLKEKNEGLSQVQYRQMLIWSHEIASGMEFLSNLGVIHADLSTRNVLLNGNGTVKITDFGLSGILEGEVYITKHGKGEGPFPIRMAPESLKYLVFMKESDVWSFGVTLWEMLSLDLPFVNFNDAEKLLKELETGVRLKRPEHLPSATYQIMEMCWKWEWNQRPNFSDIKELINKLII